MKEEGAFTLAQDEKSCAVYGMPKAAFDIGAVVRQVSMEEMAAAILKAL